MPHPKPVDSNGRKWQLSTQSYIVLLKVSQVWVIMVNKRIPGTQITHSYSCVNDFKHCTFCDQLMPVAVSLCVPLPLSSSPSAIWHVCHWGAAGHHLACIAGQLTEAQGNKGSTTPDWHISPQDPTWLQAVWEVLVGSSYLATITAEAMS